MPSSACDWSSDVCSSDRSEEHTSELQSRSDLVCRILRSEEHTSELQSRSDLVCRLLLEKKKRPDHPPARRGGGTTFNPCQVVLALALPRDTFTFQSHSGA